MNEIIVEMEHAFLFVTGISDGSVLAAVAEAGCDIGMVGYEMAVLVDRVGKMIDASARTPMTG